MIRILKYFTLKVRRKHYKSGDGLVARMLRSRLVLWNRDSAACGAAIGLFWAFIPMPFQMLPAFLFCWIVGANFPLALICVWITNPLTLAPILYLELHLGQFILSSSELSNVATGEGWGMHLSASATALYAGALITSCVTMIIGYLFIFLAFKLSDIQNSRRHRLAAKKMALPERGKLGSHD